MAHTTELLPAQDPASITRAAALLKAGELVAFPTETVYGLGANGLDAEAVAKIFAAKGRQADNPLILHVASLAQALPLWQAEPWQLQRAEKLAAAFWPGPVSLVLSASPLVPKQVTAGLDSVAVRAPAGSTATALLAQCNFPLAAPSANQSGRPSPTRAEHVAATLDGRIAAILDGGPTRIGIESTVLDLRPQTPVILRPGDLDAQSLARVIGEVRASGTDECVADAPSPGLRYRHYRPADMQVGLVDAEAIAAAWPRDEAIVCLQSTADKLGSRNAPVAILPDQAKAYAAAIYSALYDMEKSGASALLLEDLPATAEWAAVRERLRRAAQN